MEAPQQTEEREDSSAPRGDELATFGELRLHGFVSKPEIQKLNRNSIYVFVNGRLIRDRLIQHALTEAYRNILPPALYPVVLLFLEMPAAEVDVNVHPSKTEVRFRQQTAVHDFVREAVRGALMKARPVPQFMTEMRAQPTASAGIDRREHRLRRREADQSFEQSAASATRLSRCSRLHSRRPAGAFSSKAASQSRATPRLPWFACRRRSRQRVRSAAAGSGRGSAYARLAAHIEASRTDSQLVYLGRERRWSVDRRPARCARARAV